MNQTILILGAGPAGLALAVQLLRRPDLGAEVIVVEQNASVGGLTASFEYEGLHFDYGSHRLHPATAPYILQDIRSLLGAALLDRPRNGRIRLLGRFVKFPLRPADLAFHLPPAFLLGMIKDTLTKLFQSARQTQPSLAQHSFADVLLEGLGPTICNTFYFPYAQKLWGLAPQDISAVQAYKRVAANTLTKMAQKAFALVPGWKAAGAGRFFYPRHGYGQISQALGQEAKRLGGKILLSTRIQEIHVQAARPNVVVVSSKSDGSEPPPPNLFNGQNISADFVFSTVPAPILVRCLRPQPPQAVETACQQLRYRSMVLCYLVLATDQFTPFDAHYFPEADFLFSRLSEPKNYSASRQPVGLTGLCAEIPCSVGDAIWNATEDEICHTVIQELERAGLPIHVPVKASFLRRVPRVYPIYDSDYEARFRLVDEYLGQIPRLISLGRQGLFAHDNTHHTMEMAYRAGACLRPDLSWDGEQWVRDRKEFEAHVVED